MSLKCALALRMKYSVTRGFHAQLILKKGVLINAIPDEFEVVSGGVLFVLTFKCYFYYLLIQLQRTRTCITLTSVPIKSLNGRLAKFIDEIQMTSFV